MYPRKTQATMNKFNVFTVGKNTRNRQLIYFYLPPYSFCRLCVSCSRACCLRTGPFKTFSIFLFAILTVSLAIAPYIVLKLSKVSVQKLKLCMKRILMILIIRYNLRSVRTTTLKISSPSPILNSPNSGSSNPRPGLTPGTALRAVGSGINCFLNIKTWPFLPVIVTEPDWVVLSCHAHECSVLRSQSQIRNDIKGGTFVTCDVKV